MTNMQKAAKLREALELIEQAEELIRETLGETDAGQDTRHAIDDLVQDLMYDIMELEGVE